MKRALLAASVCLCGLPAMAVGLTGTTTLTVPVADRDAPLTVSLWYATSSGTPEPVGANAVFIGAEAVLDAPPTADAPLPLVLFTHGGLRSAPDSGAWLSSALADAGFLVAEINSPRVRSAAEGVNEIWRRPMDVSLALDALLTDVDWAIHIDSNRISAVGFALGGTAVLASVGARIPDGAYAETCQSPAIGTDCAWFSAQGVSPSDADLDRLQIDRTDPRLQSVVAISPEYLGLLANALSDTTVPISIIHLGGREMSGLSANATMLSETTINDSSLFDAFPACTAAGPDILAADGGNPDLCGASTAARQAVHATIAAHVIRALESDFSE